MGPSPFRTISSTQCATEHGRVLPAPMNFIPYSIGYCWGGQHNAEPVVP
jgi:hypothetical protein